MAEGRVETIEDLVQVLRMTLRNGCSAEQLVNNDALLDLLCPIHETPSGRFRRTNQALRVEAVLQDACRAVGGTIGDAAAVLMGLETSSRHLALGSRRRAVGRLLGAERGMPFSEDTVRRSKEVLLVRVVAVELLRAEVLSEGKI